MSYNVGDTVGRWTIVRNAAPRPYGGIVRRHVTCRCICGLERVLAVMVLQCGRSTGCASAECRRQHAVDIAVAAALDEERKRVASVLAEAFNPPGPSTDAGEK
jgi:hypothetical protein